MTQQVSHLGIRSFGNPKYGGGWPLDLDEEILRPQIDLLEEALQKAVRLETLRFTHFDYPGRFHDLERFQDFMRSILPRLACIPVQIGEYISPPYRPHQYAFQALHPQVKALSIRKHRLEVSDIRELGDKASEEENHPLCPYSHLVREEGVAGSIAREWNLKYARSMS